jgi:hypothetical protein
VVLFSIGGCITLKEPLDILNQWLTIGQGLKGALPKHFFLKEVAYFSSVYFAEEHNVNAPTMLYSVNEEPLCSDLSIFASRGTTVGSSTSYYSTSEERKAALLYMYANIDGMDKYFE